MPLHDARSVPSDFIEAGIVGRVECGFHILRFVDTGGEELAAEDRVLLLHDGFDFLAQDDKTGGEVNGLWACHCGCWCLECLRRCLSRTKSTGRFQEVSVTNLL